MTDQTPPPSSRKGPIIGTVLVLIGGLAAGIAGSQGLSAPQKPQEIQAVHKSTFNSNGPLQSYGGETRGLTDQERNASFLTTIHSAKPQTRAIADDKAIELGREICNAFTASATYPEVEASTTDLPNKLGPYLINASVQVYCPEFSDLLPR